MEDCCAVCADSLEWIAYGPCGHRDVCSTCVIRLRFVLSDSRCCICKTECHTVFITRAMGSFTEAKVNFSDFPPGASEGKHGNYWYHEDSQAFFDDADHYRMISAMCKLSCGICDNTTEELHRGNNYRKFRYKNIAQLKGHLYHQHRKFMCNLCLEGRKTFISEQKLYSRSQLRQHVSTGDSEVDGSESERGGFAGHPMCEFCKNPFYGDAELYMHMSREHFTCHICQRQHPGQYDYYRNYEDLETHFRQEHFLCENENCLTKKFIVFLTDAEMKRHNAIEHGGHMSRAKRNAALQIPVSFRYRRNEQDHRQGRSRDLHPEASINQLTMAIQASLETAFSEGRLNTEHGEANQTDEITGSMETLAITSHPGVDGSIIQETSFPPLSDLEQLLPSSRYAQALNKWSASHLGEESFPPLHGVKESSKPKPALFSDGADTIAARINPRNKGTVKVLHSAQPRPVKNYEAGSYTSSTIRPAQNSQKAPSPSSARPWGASSQVTQIGENCVAATIPAESAWNQKSTMIKHSSSAPNLCNSDPSGLEATSNQEILPAGNVQRANKSLVDRIRADLGNDENKYTIFKSISAEYRQGSINSWEYISYAEQFNISHLVPELAQLCPDLQKQRELLDVYNAVQRAKGMRENSGNAANLKKEAKKGKGKVKEKEENFTVKHALADNILEQVRKLQGSRYPSEEDQLEILSKDGYRANSGSKIPSTVEVGSASSSSNLNSMGHEGLKKNKKTSKFIRERLGDGSSSAFLDHLQQRSPKKIYEEDRSKPSNVLPVQGVWGRGGGQKLFAQNGATK